MYRIQIKILLFLMYPNQRYIYCFQNQFSSITINFISSAFNDTMGQLAKRQPLDLFVPSSSPGCVMDV